VTGAGAGICVRPPRPEDLGEVISLESASFADPWTDDALAQELAPDRLRLPLIAEAEGKVVGYLMAWKIVDQLHILNIAAAPACRRRGVGSALLKAAADLALEIGLTEITLEVRESNAAAQSFYLGHGFAATGRRPGYYADNGEDAIIMACSTSRVLQG
jgi:ribosomal-protein-alanine N-acetyltransferase